MLISKSKNFLFIHIPKTAGTSINEMLNNYAIPKNKNLIRRVSSYFPVRENIDKAYFRAHPKALSVSKKIGKKEFDKFFKFSVVRNPYDHAVSYYHFLKKNPDSKRHSESQSWTFEDAISYLERKNKILPVNQTSWLVNKEGIFIVDKVLFFENISTEIKELFKLLKIDPCSIPHKNSTKRKSFRSYYNEDLKSRVKNLYAKDFDNFGYCFEKNEATKNPIFI